MQNNKELKINLLVYYGLVLIPIIFSFISMFIDSLLDYEEKIFLDEAFFIEPKMWEIGVCIVALIVFIVILVGLLLRQEWGRKLFIYSYIPSFVLYFLPSGYWVYMSSIASLFYDVANMLLGMLLLILLIPSLYQPIFDKKD